MMEGDSLVLKEAIARIAELEAELNECRLKHVNIIRALMAEGRAEKAEAEVERLKLERPTGGVWFNGVHWIHRCPWCDCHLAVNDETTAWRTFLRDHLSCMRLKAKGGGRESGGEGLQPFEVSPEKEGPRSRSGPYAGTGATSQKVGSTTGTNQTSASREARALSEKTVGRRAQVEPAAANPAAPTEIDERWPNGGPDERTEDD